MTPAARRVPALAAGLLLALASAGALLAERRPAAGTLLLAAAAVAAALAATPGGLPGLARRRPRTPLPGRAGAAPGGAEPPRGRAALASRLHLLPGALLLAAVAVAGTGGNRFSLAGALAWAACVGVVAAALHLPGEARRPAAPLGGGVGAALLALTLAGGALRLFALASLPPEPTSDHVEKALDAVRIGEGARPVFCATNGGREPLQMYLLALLALLPGLAPDLHGLTTLSALEGTLTIPLLFLAGRELARPRGPRAADATGLAAAALGAVSAWHLVLSRLGLRIVLLPAAALLLLVYLLRAVRDGRRGDWLRTGLVAGLSLYTYQSARFLPLVVAGGALLAVRPTREARAALARNVAACALLAAACAAPLARYALEYPAEFWARARTRVLGDGAAPDPLSAFRSRLPDLARGVPPALAALHVRGDGSWFQAAPFRPLLDPVAVALLASGLGLAVARAVRLRDRGALVVPLALLVLLLPSAAAAAHPAENPSATRASGALAPALLLAAVGLEGAWRAARALRREAGLAVAGLLVLASAFAARSRLGEWRAAYAAAAHPHRALAAEAAAFVAAGAPFGNVFVAGLAHGPDDRAVAMEAGFPGRSPGIHPEERPLAGALEAAGRDRRRPDFDASRPLLFLLSPRDEAGLAELRALAPGARVRRVPAVGRLESVVAVEVPAGGREVRRAP